ARLQYGRDWALATAAYSGVCSQRGKLEEAKALLDEAAPQALLDEVVRGVHGVYSAVLSLATAAQLRSQGERAKAHAIHAKALQKYESLVQYQQDDILFAL